MTDVNQEPQAVDEQVVDANLDANLDAQSQGEIDQEGQANEIDALNNTIKTLQEELKDAKELAAYANAESYNAIRRIEAEVEKSKKYALEKIAKELLNTVDNFERAFDSSEGVPSAFLEGIELTHKSLLSSLAHNGISVIDPIGEKFNPELHEAVGTIADVDTDVVGEVLQKGYTLHGRTIRPAMVKVGA